MTEEEFKKKAKTIPIDVEKEEAEAINYFKYKILPTSNGIGFESEEEHYNKVLLNLIEKLQKENEELRVQGSIILLDYNILKDKIKEIIKEELPDDDICKSCGRYDVNGVVIKQKLIKVLEED